VNSQKSLSLPFRFFMLVLCCASLLKTMYVVSVQPIPLVITNNMEIDSFLPELNIAEVRARLRNGSSTFFLV